MKRTNRTSRRSILAAGASPAPVAAWWLVAAAGIASGTAWAQQPAEEPPAGVFGPRGADPRNQPRPAVADFDPEERILLSFPGQSVDLPTFAEYVSRKLGVNIFSDEGLQNIRIVFQAPLEVRAGDLLTLLSRFVEDRGFALVRDPMGWYQIKTAANMVPNFAEGDFSTTRVIRTPLVKPSAVQQPITTTLGATAAGAVRMTALDEIGILIVTGPPSIVDNVNTLVQRILAEQAGQKLHRFMLENVASDFARNRVMVLNGRLAPSAAAPGQPGQPGAVAVSGSLSNLDSRLLTDRGNALIFRGTEDERRILEQLIEVVDVVTPLIARRYAAGNVAEEVARAGERMGLGPVTLAGSPSVGSGPGGALRPTPLGQQPEQEINGSQFTVDAEQGSFVYFGNERQHEIVENLVKTFTEQQLGARVEIKMYKLNNANAEGVAQVLQQIVQESQLRTGTSPFIPGSRQQFTRRQPAVDSQLLAQQGEGEAAAPVVGEGGGVNLTATEGEVSIVSDPDRNQVIIKASARQQREFERLIRDLDQRQPQVYLSAQIVSVTTSDNFDWTVETQINAGQFLIFSNFGLTAPGTSGGTDGQPATNPRVVPSNTRGVTTALIKSDYLPFVLNTLQSEANGRIESTPRILVNDNQTGSIASEREEPFSTTTQGTATTTTGQGGVATAGTNLQVTPRISSGGYVTLEYRVELSSFDRSIGQAQGLQPPVQRDIYESTVQIPSDSTIVVGGFTLDQRTESESRIPLLGDIPIIGNLFKSYSRNNQKITIFVFITPTIMTDPNFLDLRLATDGPMKQVEVDGITPRLYPAVISIRESDLVSGDRRLPASPPPRRAPMIGMTGE